MKQGTEAKMQTQFEIKEPKTRKKASSLIGVRIVNRDLEILRYLLQMKFSSVDEIHRKFFPGSIAKSRANAFRTTRDRLAILKRLGLITTTQSLFSRRQYFLCTWKGYYAVAREWDKFALPKPVLRIDIRTFDHDVAVQDFRLSLEESSGQIDWISERELKSGHPDFPSLGGAFTPDGGYRLPSGECVAFELEISQKARNRYIEKVSRYVDLFRNDEDFRTKVTKVHVLCLRQTVFDIWQDECRLFSEYFNLELQLPADRALRGIA